jgi:signal transduction histidine kinase
MKLHLIAERQPSTSTSVSRADIAQLKDLLAEIAHEIETFGDDNEASIDTSLSDLLSALAYKWQGMIDVHHDASTQVLDVLDADTVLKDVVVAACSEAVTNAARHGKATQISLQLGLAEQASIVQLVAQDNGAGVPRTLLPGIGLKDIEADGGNWHFEPCEGGARFCVEFPTAQTPAGLASTT